MTMTTAAVALLALAAAPTRGAQPWTEHLFEADCWSEYEWCKMPYLNHAAVTFGDGNASRSAYSTDAHTIGGAFGVSGLAVNGKARIGSGDRTVSVYGTSIVTGGLVGTGLPRFQDGLLGEVDEFTERYDQARWRQYALDLESAAGRGDAGIQTRVRFYYPERNPIPGKPGLVIIKNDSPDYVSSGEQVVHVVIGEGRVRADNDQGSKIDGAIIAPDADVQIHRRWQHAHGFIVARTVREWWVGKEGDSGLQMHGQNATGVHCSVPRPDCGDHKPKCPGAEEMKSYCKQPEIKHAVVVFGEGASAVSGLPAAYSTDAHTLGGYGTTEGVAVRGDARIGTSHGVVVPGQSIVTGTIHQWEPNFHSGVLTGAEGLKAFNAQYDAAAWRRYAEDLYESYGKGDTGVGARVRFYHLDEDTPKVVIGGDGPTDYPVPDQQILHVVFGSGTVVHNDDENDKLDGAIIAPDANVWIHRDIGYIHGYVVARTLREKETGRNTGLQIHGQIPAGIECQCAPSGEADCPSTSKCIPLPAVEDDFDTTQ